jgi:homoserine dehydrogenase
MVATASAVMGDVMAIARNLLAGDGSRSPAMAYFPECVRDLPIRAMDDIVSQYYLRFATVDQPGVLAQIAGSLGKYDISIASMIQPERQVGGAVPIVIMTHEAREADIRRALAEIDNLAAVREKSRLIRIESGLE